MLNVRLVDSTAAHKMESKLVSSWAMKGSRKRRVTTQCEFQDEEGSLWREFLVHPDPAAEQNDRSLAADSRAGRLNAKIFTVLAFSTEPVIDPAQADKSSQDGRYFLCEPYTRARSACTRWIRMIQFADPD